MKLLKLYEGVLNETESEFCLAEIKDIITNGKQLRPDYIKGIKALKKCVESNPEMLHPEGAAYRGINMPLSDLLDHYADITDDKKKGGKFNFVYKAKDAIQGWSDDRTDIENSVEVNPQLTMAINQYKNGNPKELLQQLKDITVPVIITLNASQDDFIIKGLYLKQLSDDKDDLFRINSQPTRVSAKIVEPMFDSVYEILTLIKRLDKSK